MKWNRFEEVIFDMENGSGIYKGLGLKIKIEVLGPLECPSPSWDLNNKYRVDLVSGELQIQVLDCGLWVTANIEPPKINAT